LSNLAAAHYSYLSIRTGLRRAAANAGIKAPTAAATTAAAAIHIAE
jgi:hypothetical protein